MTEEQRPFAWCDAPWPTRRVMMSGLAASLLAPVPLFGQDAERRGALESALARVERTGDLFDVSKARFDLALDLLNPHFGMSEADRDRARALLEANFSPAVARASPGAAALSRLHWAQMTLDEPREVTARHLRRIAAEVIAAANLLPFGTPVQLSLALAGLTATVALNNDVDAGRWLAIGLDAVGRIGGRPVPGLSQDASASIELGEMAELFALAALREARGGRAVSAIGCLEAAKAVSSGATQTAALNRLPDVSDVEATLRAAAARFDAVVHLIVTNVGAAAIVTRLTGNRLDSSIGTVVSADGRPFDGKAAQELLWGSLYRHIFITQRIGGWHGAYAAMDPEVGSGGGPTFQNALPRLGEVAWRAYGASLARSLRERGVAPGGRVAFVIPDELAYLPLRLLGDAGDGMLRTCAPAEIPSTRIVARVRAAPVGPPRLAGLFNPTGDLTGAEGERALVANLFSPGASVDLPANLPPSDFLRRATRSNPDYLYLATHGASGFGPRTGVLIGRGTSLALADLRAFRAALNVRLVVLSACELARSGLIALERNPTNMPSAFIGLGAQGVIAALWKVADDSTPLLMHEMMRRHVREGLDPARALSGAQVWLREQTAAQIITYLRTIVAASPRADWTRVEEMIERLSAESPASRPFASPYHWAGFAFYGS